MCANASQPATAGSTRAMRAAVVCLINQQRVRHGLPALRVSPLLDRSAQAWTNVMVATGKFWHGINFAARITAVGFIWQDAGENIATGFPTPASVVSAWMASKDHCQNILDPRYDRVGTGLSRHAVGELRQRPVDLDPGLRAADAGPRALAQPRADERLPVLAAPWDR